MLDRTGQCPALNEVTDRLPCRVALPEEWVDFFDQSGPLPSGPTDVRKRPRYYYRETMAIRYRQTFPTLYRNSCWYTVYTRDLSRSGLSFLHFEQLFPGERFVALLPGDKEAAIEVMRCQRVQDFCFIVGARFVANATMAS